MIIVLVNKRNAVAGFTVYFAKRYYEEFVQRGLNNTKTIGTCSKKRRDVCDESGIGLTYLLHMKINKSNW